MDFLEKALAYSADSAEIYRWFHRHPETSHNERETNKKIRQLLTAWEILFLAPADNITIAVLDSGKPGKTVGIRCDTDALQMEELTSLPYRSENRGVMHGCGHDGHITAGLIAARILHERADAWNGRVKVIFQPAEEGEFGAHEVLSTGLVNDVNAFFAIHLWSPYPTGELRVSSGGVAASTDMFMIRIRGRGGHGATPEKCVDAIACACALVQNLQYIVSRFTSPMDPVVITVGSFHAGTRCNIIAGEAVLEGTIRTFNPDVYARVHEHFDRVLRDTASAFGCAYDIDMRAACGVTWNDAQLVKRALSSAQTVAKDAMIGEDAPSMLGDDFAEYRRVAPVCYAKVGIRNEKINAVYAHHHGLFRVDEDALPIAAAWMCAFVAQG